MSSFLLSISSSYLLAKVCLKSVIAGLCSFSLQSDTNSFSLRKIDLFPQRKKMKQFSDNISRNKRHSQLLSVILKF